MQAKFCAEFKRTRLDTTIQCHVVILRCNLGAGWGWRPGARGRARARAGHRGAGGLVAGRCRLGAGGWGSVWGTPPRTKGGGLGGGGCGGVGTDGQGVRAGGRGAGGGRGAAKTGRENCTGTGAGGLGVRGPGGRGWACERLRTLRERFANALATIPGQRLDPWTPTFKTGTLLLRIREK